MRSSTDSRNMGSEVGYHHGGSERGRLDEPHRKESGLTRDLHLSSGIISLRD